MEEAYEKEQFRIIIPRASGLEARLAVSTAESNGIEGVSVRPCRDSFGCAAHELLASSYDDAATAFELFLVNRARRASLLKSYLRRPFDVARLPHYRANACTRVRDAYSFSDGHGSCVLLVNPHASEGDRVRAVRTRPDNSSAALEKFLDMPELETPALAACTLASEPFCAYALLWERVCRPFLGSQAPSNAEGVLLRSYWMLRRHTASLSLDGFEEQGKAAMKLLTPEQVASLAALVPTRKETKTC